MSHGSLVRRAVTAHLVLMVWVGPVTAAVARMALLKAGRKAGVGVP